MNEIKESKRGGKREGAGRPKGNDPIKKFSMSAHLSEYLLIKENAQKEGKSISRYLIDLAIKEI